MCPSGRRVSRPVTVMSGGAHPHFHQPSDTADTVNPEISTVRRLLCAGAHIGHWPTSHRPRHAALAKMREAEMWIYSGYGISSRIVDWMSPEGLSRRDRQR